MSDEEFLKAYVAFYMAKNYEPVIDSQVLKGIAEFMETPPKPAWEVTGPSYSYSGSGGGLPLGIGLAIGLSM